MIAQIKDTGYFVLHDKENNPDLDTIHKCKFLKETNDGVECIHCLVFDDFYVF